jgi:4-hydroxy-tetrahydrodipicolinate reductase
MKIAIIGYGRIGKMIESIAIQRGHTIGSCIDVDNQDLLSPDNLRLHDVAVEFTTPETAYGNISRCLDAGLPVVSGTTGWTNRLEELIERCKKENGSFLYASNFSLGVNILFHLNRQLAAIMNRYGQYDVRMTEIHHIHKLDAPSGTALSLAEGILGEIGRKKGWLLKGAGSQHPQATAGKPEQERERKQEPGPGKEQEPDSLADQLVIEAIRAGTVAGVHEVTYESEFDSLSIRHSAKDRRGFANGAILAAEYIHDKKGFFTMKEVLDL